MTCDCSKRWPDTVGPPPCPECGHSAMSHYADGCTGRSFNDLAKETPVDIRLSRLHELMRSVRDTLPECDGGSLSVVRPVEEWAEVVAEYDALIEDRREA